MVVTRGRGRGRGQRRVAWMHAQRHVGVPWWHWVGHGRRRGGSAKQGEGRGYVVGLGVCGACCCCSTLALEALGRRAACGLGHCVVWRGEKG